MTHLDAGLGRAQRVEQEDVRHRGQQSIAYAGSQRRPTVADGGDRADVVPAFFDRLDQRSRHRVADDRDADDAFGQGGLDRLAHVLMHHVAGQHELAAGGDHVERRPLSGAVHERRKHQETHATVGINGRLRDLLIGLVGGVGAERRAAHRGDVDVVVPPLHALGHAGGAAGIHQKAVVAIGSRHAGRRSRGRNDRLVVDRPI